MPIDKRHKNKVWDLPTDDRGRIETWDAVKVAVLMDIRDELQKLNTLFHCINFTDVPFKLDRIAKAAASTRTHAGRIAARVAPIRKKAK